MTHPHSTPMRDEPSKQDEEALAEVLYAIERKTYVGYPPWREARYGEPHVVGARNTCLYTARAVLRSDWYADHEAQIRDLLEEREELLTEIRRLRMGALLVLADVRDAAARETALREALTERDAEHEGGEGA